MHKGFLPLCRRYQSHPVLSLNWFETQLFHKRMWICDLIILVQLEKIKNWIEKINSKKNETMVIVIFFKIENHGFGTPHKSLEMESPLLCLLPSQRANNFLYFHLLLLSFYNLFTSIYSLDRHEAVKIPTLLVNAYSKIWSSCHNNPPLLKNPWCSFLFHSIL